MNDGYAALEKHGERSATMEYQGNAPGSPEAFRVLRAQLQELCSVCTVLTDSTDLEHLWKRIVKNAQLQLNVDGCTFYSIDNDHLRFRVILSNSLGIISDASGADAPEAGEFPHIPLYRDDGSPNSDSLAARVAVSGELINIPNVERTPHYSTSRTREFDERMGYQTRSLLTVPVRFQSEPVSGVLQFVNAKNADGAVVDFDDQREVIACALASLIAVAARLR